MNPITNPQYEYIFFNDKELWDSFLDSKDRIKIETFFDKFFKLLIMRKDKLKDTSLDSLAFATYFDMILVQLRAICFENPSKEHNITVQNYLKKLLDNKGKQELDEYFNKDIYFTNAPDAETDQRTLKAAIKIIVDKRIAHNDNLKQDEVFLIDEIQRILLTPSHKHYICAIVEGIEEIIKRNTNQHYWESVKESVKTLDPNKRYRFEVRFSGEE